MTGILRVLGLALIAVCVVGPAGAQGAWSHEFHSENERTVLTGKNFGAEKFKIGSVGTVECAKTEFESTVTGSEVYEDTYRADTITVSPRYSECTFGGQPAVVRFNHCAYVFDSDTTLGNSDFPKEEHANMEIECGLLTDRIEIDTSVCTVTITPQVINHAIRYENIGFHEFKVRSTAKGIVVGRAKTTEGQTGCIFFPTGAVGTYYGSSTFECRQDFAFEEITGTSKTTPTTTEGITSDCSVV